MALPPEQINIKRRREEEPVETLCMNSSPFFWCQPRDLHSPKHCSFYCVGSSFQEILHFFESQFASLVFPLDLQFTT